MRRALVRGSFLVVGSTLVWHGVNVLFNGAAARILGSESYGDLAAVVALLTITGPFFVSLHTVASRQTTELAVAGQWDRVSGLLRFYGVRLAFGGLLLAALGVLGATAVARFLRLPSALPVAIAAASFAPSMLMHLQRGVLQGAGRFGRYAISVLAEAAVKLVVGGVLLLVLWRTVSGAALALTITIVCVAAVNVVLLRFLPRRPDLAKGIEHPYAYSLATLATLVLLALMISVDVLAANRYLEPRTAGLYAAIALAGKIVFFATSSLSLVVLFPWFSARQEGGRDSRRPLFLALAGTAAVSLVPVAVYFATPQFVVGPLFGSGYDGAEEWIGWMALAYTGYALVYLAATYLLSQRSTAGVAVLAVAVLAQFGALYSFHGSVRALVIVQGSVLGGAAVAMVWLCAAIKLRPAAQPLHLSTGELV